MATPIIQINNKSKGTHIAVQRLECGEYHVVDANIELMSIDDLQSMAYSIRRKCEKLEKEAKIIPLCQ